MSAVLTPRYTFEQYLARERVAETKSEFYDGQIFAMAGGSVRHNTICVNLVAGLHRRLRGSPCRPCNSDQRIRIPAKGLATYPDVSVVSGEVQIDVKDSDAITNPTVIFEVLSRTTESYDRGRKFDFYRELDSLQEYILVGQETPQIERFVRQSDGKWLLNVIKELTADLEIGALSIALPLSEIYDGVTFGQEGMG